MSDTFAGTGIQSIIKPLAPKGSGWREVPADQRFSGGHPLRAFMHTSNIFVMSAVEYVGDTGQEPGQEYHISISRPASPGVVARCTSNEAKWVLRQFRLEGALEDNHVPGGKVRNYWRPVADPLVGKVCPCNEEEPAIVEDKGDFVWRGITS
jgi:hypothetical protein